MYRLKCAGRIKQLRNEKNLTQKDLAEKLHIGRSSIANWETGTRVPSMKHIQDMVVIFCVPADYICGTSDRRYNIKIPSGVQIDMSKLNAKGMKALSEYFELLVNNEKYVVK